jgi:threonine/homoserine efflux transporter RhtA
VLIGLSRRQQHVAWVGMATLALVVGKLLTVDLAEVDTFWRAGLFFVVGAGFLWLSTRIPSLTASAEKVSDDESTAP